MRRLRTQLIIAFVVLSVVPLTAIVSFGYYTSEQTFRRAVEQETTLTPCNGPCGCDIDAFSYAAIEETPPSNRWQATKCPGETSRRAGSNREQCGMTKGQRVWKWQPDGGLSGDGTSPFSSISSSCRPGQATRTAEPPEDRLPT